jgi:PKD repeat protein/sugar lactone lactonase YvrE
LSIKGNPITLLMKKYSISGVSIFAFILLLFSFSGKVSAQCAGTVINTKTIVAAGTTLFVNGGPLIINDTLINNGQVIVVDNGGCRGDIILGAGGYIINTDTISFTGDWTNNSLIIWNNGNNVIGGLIIMKGTTNQVINAGKGLKVQNFQIQNSLKQLHGQLIVERAFDMQTIIQTTDTLGVDSAGFIINYSAIAFVKGPLYRMGRDGASFNRDPSPMIFPVGDSAGNYRPVILDSLPLNSGFSQKPIIKVEAIQTLVATASFSGNVSELFHKRYWQIGTIRGIFDAFITLGFSPALDVAGTPGTSLLVANTRGLSQDASYNSMGNSGSSANWIRSMVTFNAGGPSQNYFALAIICTPLTGTFNVAPNDSICPGATAIFSVTAPSGNYDSLYYYINNVLAAGGKLDSGQVFSSSSIANNDTVYAKMKTGACLSPTNKIVMKVSPQTSTNSGNVTSCGLTPVALTGSTTFASSSTWITAGAGTFSPSASALIVTYTPSAADVTAGSRVISLNANSPGCALVSSSLTLTLNSAPAITTQPIAQIICAGSNTSYTVVATGAGLTYQWQVDQGAGFANVVNGGVYSNATTATLNITAATAVMNGYQYKVIVTGSCTPAVTSSSVLLTINSAPAITTQPIAQIICAGANASYTVAATGAGLTFQWQVDQGAGFANVVNGGVYSNATTATLNITAATAVMNGYQYKVIVTGTCTPAVTSSSVLLTINSAPAITTQPIAQTICAGANASYTVAATGAGLTYQWQVDQGAGFANVVNGGVYSNATTATLNITAATAVMNGYLYKVIVTGTCAPAATSSSVLLTINSAPAITTQPIAQTICAGANTSYTVVATGASLTYQWQVDQGAGFANVVNGGVYSNATTATLNITAATAAMNGYQYQVIVSGTCAPSVASSSALLTINAAPAITTQPLPRTICAGANASYAVVATGAGLTFQWQVDQGAGFANVVNGGVYSNATTATLNITAATAAMNGYQYKVIVTGSCAPAVTSSTALLTVNSPAAITTQPTDQTICAGANTSFSVTATGAGIAYQWQVDQGAGFGNVPVGAPYGGNTTATLTITGAIAAMNGYKYQVGMAATCPGLAISNTVILTVNSPPAVTTQPVDQAVCVGANTSFTVATTGAGLTYQWQEKVGIGAFANIANGGVYSGATSASLTLTGVPVGMSTNKYQVIVTGTCLPAVTSAFATLTVNSAPTILQPPANLTICPGANASFTVTAGGAGLTYQWQEDPNTGTFANIADGGIYAGATATTLTLAGVPVGMNNYKYKVIVTGTCAPTTTATATLTVNSPPAITGQPVDMVICAGTNTTFTAVATGAGLTYQWQEDPNTGTFANVANGGIYSGVTSATITLTGVPVAKNNFKYRVIITGTCAPAVTSLSATLTVGTAPTITVQPVFQAVCSGSNAVFSVTATGALLTYQWQEKVGALAFANISDGGMYSGSTTSTLTLTNPPVGATGNKYQVIVSGACAPSVTSIPVDMSVGTPPAITLQPTPKTVCAGSNISFVVTATGSALTYQWQEKVGLGAFANIVNGGVYSGATTATLSLTGVPVGMSTNQYQVIVSGACPPAVTSTAVDLTVNTSPAITVQPVTQIICAGANTSFTVTATGTGLTYQWQVDQGLGFANVVNGGVYSNATTATLNITTATAAMNNYQYQVIVTGTCTPVLTSNKAALTVNTAPAITAQPVAQTICAGDNASFSVTATGTGLTYQWQENQGVGFANILNGGLYSNATASTLNINGATATMNTYLYQVIVTGTCAPALTSSSALLTVNTPPAITTQPLPQVICAGANALFTVAATGGGLTFQWQENQGAGFANVVNGGVYSNATTSTLNITTATAAMNTYLYRVIVTGTCSPAVTSSSALLTVNTVPAISSQPLPQTICAGANASFRVIATGAGLTYQWQENQGAGFANVVNGGVYSNATTATLNITAATLAMNTYLYQVVVTGTCVPGVTSSSALLTINAAPAITIQPIAQTICAGANASYTVAATGAGLTYQWQVDQGAGFANVVNGGVYTNATTATLNITAATAAMNAYQYQVIVTGTCAPAVTSSSALFTINAAPAITTQPVAQTICAGANISFTVAATGGGLTYQWQVDQGAGFANVVNGGVYTNATTTTLNITAATAVMNGYQYKVIVTGTCAPAVTSSAALLTINAAPAITTQPIAQTICAGANASYTVAATGTGLTYQWQESTGGPFVNLANGGVYSNVTTATLNITAATAVMNAYQYQVIVTGTCAPAVASSSALLTINAAPAITTQPLAQSICAGANTSFTVVATGTGLTYQWQIDQGAGFANVVNGGVYSNATTATLNITAATAAMNGYQYKVIVTGTCAPAVTSSTALLTVNPVPSITTQPTAQTICSGANTSFTVVATGGGLTYQWQENQGLGFANLSNGGVYSNVTTATMNITAAPLSMSTYQYQVIVTGSCAPPATSNSVTLTVNPSTAINTQPIAKAVCSGANTSFTVVASGGGLTYQWQVNQGAGFVNVVNGGVYTNATTATLNITAATAVMNAYLYQVIVSGTCPIGSITSNSAALTVNTAPAITAQPVSQSICAGSNASYSVTATGSAITYQWQEKVGAGAFANISNGGVYSGATASTLNLTGVPAGMSTNQYQVIVSGVCPAPVTSSPAATLTVTPTRVVGAGPDQTFCTNLASVTLAGTINPAGVPAWSTSGTGSFSPDASTLNASYTPSPLDKTLASVTLTLTYPATGGCPASSDQMIITIVPGTLNAPTVTTSNVSANSIEWDWSAVPNATGYKVQFTTPAPAGPFGPTSGALKHVGVGLLPSTQYCVIIQDTNACMTKNSQPVCATTLSGIACDTGWSVAGAPFCIASTKSPLIPSVAGGVFTGPGVVLITGTYYFDPLISGAGTFNVTYTRCGKFLTKAMVVADAPCIASITPLGVGGFPLISQPQGIASDCDGSIYFSDTGNDAVWTINPFGVASVLFGDTTGSGDVNGTVPPASNVKIKTPTGVIAFNGDIYFADAGNNKIKKYTKATGAVSLVAGSTIGNLPTLGNSTTVAASKFNAPSSVVINLTGTVLYVADRTNAAIKKIDLIGGTVTNIATTKIGGITDAPTSLALYQNSLYYAMPGEGAIGVVDLTSNGGVPPFTTSTYYQGTAGEDPTGLSVDCQGTVYYTNAHAFSGEVKSVNSLNSSTVLIDNTTNPGLLVNPTALSVYNKGFVDIANTGNNQILRFAINNWKSGAFFGLDTTHCITEPADNLAPKTCALPGGFFYTGPGIQVAGGNYSFNPSAAGAGRHRIVYHFAAGFCTDSLITYANVYPLPTPNLGADTSVCTNNFGAFTLNAGKNGTKLYANYVWTAASTTPANTVAPGSCNCQFYTPPLPAASPFYYAVTVTDSNSCVGRYERMVTKLAVTPVTITSPADTVCYGGSVALQAIPGGLSYSWNDGSIINPITASNSGDYIVTAKNASGCFSTATKRITVRTLPTVCISVPPAYNYGIWNVSTLAGSATNVSGNTDNQKGTSARFNTPWDVYFNGGNLYVTEAQRVRKIRLSDTMVTTFIGSLGGLFNDSVPRLQARMNSPKGIVADRFGNYYIANRDYVAKLDVVKESLYIIAGSEFVNGYADAVGDLARFDDPKDIDIDYFGNIYVADYNNHVIRKITTAGVVTTYAGAGAPAGHLEGTGIAAKFNWPFGVAFDASSNLFVIEEGGQIVRKINAARLTSTIAGAYNTAGYVSTTPWVSVPGATARFSNPWNVVIDKSGKMFLTDPLNSSIRMIDKLGNVTTIAGKVLAGNGVSGFVDGRGDTATFNVPNGITMDPATGELYVADRGNNKIRKLAQNKTIAICPGTTVSVDATCSGAGNTYVWKKAGVPLSNVATYNITTSGTYIVTVTDSKGCSNTDSIIVTLKAAPVANAAGLDTISCGPVKNKKLGIAPIPGYGYSWNTSPPSGPPFSNIPQPVIGLINSTTSFVVTDTLKSTGCINRDTVTVAILPVPFAGIGVDTTVCQWESFQRGPAMVPNSSYKYTWSTLPVGPDSTYSPITISATSPGTFNFYLAVRDTINGCIGRDTMVVTVNPVPAPIIPNVTGCRGLPYSFTVPGGDYTKYHYEWQDAAGNPAGFAPNDTSFLVNSVISATKTFQLIVTNKLTGCIGYAFPGVVMINSPLAGFTSSSYCFPDSTVFVDTSFAGGIITNWTWEFGDPVTGSNDTIRQVSQAQVYHKYSAGGIYNAKLIVTNDNLCSDTAKAVIIVTDVTAAFTATPSALCLGTLDSLKNFSTVSAGSAVPTYLWDFGDLSPTSTLTNVNHTYAAVSNPFFTVKLVASSNGCKDSTTHNVIVNPMPDATITPTAFASCTGINDTLAISSLYDSPAYTIKWENVTTGMVIVSGSDTSKIIVTASGKYKATVTNIASQCSDAKSVDISFTDVTAGFTIAPGNVCLGTPDTMKNASVALPVNAILTYKWDFGDLSPTSNAVNPPHTYLTANTFTLKLVATANACSDSITKTVTVSPIPNATIKANSTSSCIGTNDTLSINSLYDSPPYTVVWQNLTTGLVVANDTSKIIVSTSGNYKVTVTDTVSLCSNTHTVTVNFINPPLAPAISAPASSCSSAPLKLVGTIASGDSLSFAWITSGNGIFSAATNDTTLYTPDPLDPSPLSFTFSAYNRCDSLSLTKSVALLAAPTGLFTFTPAEPFENDLLIFVNNSDTTGGKISSWTWTFDDGTTSTLFNPTHAFQKAGKHLITLDLKSNLGCLGQVKDSVYVSGPRIFIPNVFAPSANNPENMVCKVYGVSISPLDFSFKIFDKWGTIVYQTTDFVTANTVGWNGNNLSGGDPLPMGVYTYAVKGHFFDGGTFEKAGTVTLIR